MFGMKTRTWRGVAFFIALITTFTPLFSFASTISSTILGQAQNIQPLYLYIPSIKLLSNVQGVGVNEKGNMDVPSGKTTNVGWYKYGVAPGGVGTAVIDAHNTAAFKTLSKVPLGAEIYVYTSEGKWLKFKVTKAKTYAMKNLSPSTLFAATNSRQINLITCAGQNLGNGEATHRLIVSAVLS